MTQIFEPARRETPARREYPARREEAARRDSWAAMRRGLRGRCPNCGRGHLFRAFLKVVDQCPVCGEDFHHHRADDAPAYFVILIVGHLVMPAVLLVEQTFAPPYWLHAMLWLPIILGLALVLLQPVKGAIVAWQWAHRMHGFDPDAEHEDDGTPMRLSERAP